MAMKFFSDKEMEFSKMDTSQNQDQKKNESEFISAKQSHDNTIRNLKSDGYHLNGKWISVSPDLKNLPEIDYQDPAVQAWIEEIEADRKKRGPKLTHKELIQSVESKMSKN